MLYSLFVLFTKKAYVSEDSTSPFELVQREEASQAKKPILGGTMEFQIEREGKTASGDRSEALYVCFIEKPPSPTPFKRSLSSPMGLIFSLWIVKRKLSVPPAPSRRVTLGRSGTSSLPPCYNPTNLPQWHLFALPEKTRKGKLSSSPPRRITHLSKNLPFCHHLRRKPHFGERMTILSRFLSTTQHHSRP